MVTIRLRRQGNKDNPFYRVVVADSRSKRDGKFIEIVGTYDPSNADSTTIKLDRVDEWISKGAKPSDTVGQIIKKVRKAEAAAA